MGSMTKTTQLLLFVSQERMMPTKEKKGKKKKGPQRQSISVQMANDKNLEVEHDAKMARLQSRGKKKEQEKEKGKEEEEAAAMEIEGEKLKGAAKEKEAPAAGSRKRKENGEFGQKRNTFSLDDGRKRKKGSQVRETRLVDEGSSAKILKMAAEQLKEEEEEEGRGGKEEREGVFSGSGALDVDDASGDLSRSLSDFVSLLHFFSFFSSLSLTLYIRLSPSFSLPSHFTPSFPPSHTEVDGFSETEEEYAAFEYEAEVKLSEADERAVAMFMSKGEGERKTLADVMREKLQLQDQVAMR